MVGLLNDARQHSTTTDPCSRGNEIWGKIGCKTACVKDISEIGAPSTSSRVFGGSTSSYRMMSVKFYDDRPWLPWQRHLRPNRPYLSWRASDIASHQTWKHWANVGFRLEGWKPKLDIGKTLAQCWQLYVLHDWAYVWNHALTQRSLDKHSQCCQGLETTMREMSRPSPLLLSPRILFPSL